MKRARPTEPAARRTLDQWDDTHDVSILYILKQCVLPLTAPGRDLVADSHPFDMDAARFDARVARVAAFTVRERLGPSSAAMDINADALLSERPSFVDLFEAALYFNDTGLLALLNKILAEKDESDRFRRFWRRHGMRFSYAIGRAGRTSWPAHMVVDKEIFDPISLFIGLLVGGHSVRARQHTPPTMDIEETITWLFRLGELQRFVDSGIFAHMCEQLTGARMTTLVRSIVREPNGKRALLLALIGVLRSRPLKEADKWIYLIGVSDTVLDVLFELIDPDHETDYTPDEYQTMLERLGYTLPVDFQMANLHYMANGRHSDGPITQTLVTLLERYPLSPAVWSGVCYRLLCEDKLHMLTTRPPPVVYTVACMRGFSHVHVSLERALTFVDMCPVAPGHGVSPGLVPVFHGLTPGEWHQLATHLGKVRPTNVHELCWQLRGLYAHEEAVSLAIIPLCDRKNLFYILLKAFPVLDLSRALIRGLAMHVMPAMFMLIYISKVTAALRAMSSHRPWTAATRPYDAHPHRSTNAFLGSVVSSGSVSLGQVADNVSMLVAMVTDYTAEFKKWVRNHPNVKNDPVAQLAEIRKGGRQLSACMNQFDELSMEFSIEMNRHVAVWRKELTRAFSDD